MAFDFRELLEELCNSIVSFYDSPRDNTAHLWLQGCDMCVCFTVENHRGFLLKELISLPVYGLHNVTPMLILQQQGNMILEQGHPGRVCMDALDDEQISLMYSLTIPTSLDLSSACLLVDAAGQALANLEEAMKPLESRIIDGRLENADAFLTPILQEEDAIEITVSPALRLLKLTPEQRNILLSFFDSNKIQLNAFLQTKGLDIFPVVTDQSCQICIANGCACWPITNLPIVKSINRTQLEDLLSSPYDIYRAACLFLGLPYKSLYTVLSEVDLSLGG